ncbi:MAG: DNA polymerase III subunit delta [Nitrospirae bacterium GWC2_57_13]|nr:MAG: DNA polymerase III subunit delta [Nitrospirae bacterium GWC2_57_13]
MHHACITQAQFHIMIKYPQLIADIKRRKILPLYLFYGEEEYLIQEALDLLVKTVVDPSAKDFSYGSFSCRETPAGEIVAQAQTMPFLSEKRLVIAKDLDAWKAADLEELQAYLASPSPYACLVLVSYERRYDKKAVLAAVEKAGAVTAFYALQERELPGWVAGWARERGKAINADAVQFIIQVVGGDLQKIRNELEKVELAIQDRKTITLSDVQRIVGDFREFSAFDLAEAIGRRDGEKALLVLSRLLQEGDQPLGLLGMVAWNMRRLVRAREMEKAGVGQDEIMKKLKVMFWQTASFREQMSRYGREELRTAFSLMAGADRALKSSGLRGELVLGRMILELCGGMNAEGARMGRLGR